LIKEIEKKEAELQDFCPKVVREFFAHARAILMDFPMLNTVLSFLRRGKPVEALATVKVMRNNRMGTPLPEWFGRAENLVYKHLGLMSD